MRASSKVRLRWLPDATGTSADAQNLPKAITNNGNSIADDVANGVNASVAG